MSSSIRDAAACCGLGTSFSVVGDLLGLKRLSKISVTSEGRVVAALEPGVPLPLLRRKDGSEVTMQHLSLRNQTEAILQRGFNLNVHVVLPTGDLKGDGGPGGETPPNVDEGAMPWFDWTGVQKGVLNPHEFVRRVSAALYVARMLFAGAPDKTALKIGVRRVRWMFVGTGVTVLGNELDEGDTTGMLKALGSLHDRQIGENPAQMESRRALNAYFVPALGSGNLGIAGLATCSPTPPADVFLGVAAGAVGAAAGAGVGSFWGCLAGAIVAGPAGCAVGAAIGAGVGAGAGATGAARVATLINVPACAIAIDGGEFRVKDKATSGDNHVEGDYQAGKTLAHELGHTMWMSLGHWREEKMRSVDERLSWEPAPDWSASLHDDVIDPPDGSVGVDSIAAETRSEWTGSVMNQGLPRFVDANGKAVGPFFSGSPVRFSMFFTSDERSRMVEHSCVRRCP